MILFQTKFYLIRNNTPIVKTNCDFPGDKWLWNLTQSYLLNNIYDKDIPNYFFSIRIFFHRHWRFAGQQEKGGDHFLFHSASPTRSRTFRHLFATLQVRWLSRIFNRIACIYQTATRLNLPPYWITVWLIDDATLLCLFVCLLDYLILSFYYSNLTR